MALTYHIDVERRLVEIVHHGALGTGEWEPLIGTILEDPSYEPGFSFIEDLSDVAGLPETADVKSGIRQLLDERYRLGPCRYAVVVSRDNTAFYGLVRMAELTLEHSSLDLRAFETRDEALAWLSEVRQAH